MTTFKLARGLRPRRLSKEDLEEVARQGQEWSKRIGEETAKMEWLTAEDMATVVGGGCCSCHK